MKYYMREYWEMMNSDDRDVRDKGDVAWIESSKQYSSYFESIKKNLPKGFLNVYEKNDCFHDFQIISINFVNIKRHMPIAEIQIKKGEIAYKLTFAGVKSFVVNIPTIQNWMCGIFTWGYSEFEINDNNTWAISVLCDFDCEIEILFKRISITKIR